MMKIPPRNGIPTPVSAPQPREVPAAAARAGKADASNFDRIKISSDRSVGSRFEMELKSRLSQEVRTATTTGTLTALREKIEAGEYQIDPVAIARRMLLIEGDV